MQPRIAILTALPKELAAVKLLIQESKPHSVENDSTIYTIGKIPSQGGDTHEVVLACLPKYANNPAAITATNVFRSFPSINDIIFVGIAAAVPRPANPNAHVRLGDVVVSCSGVVQYDLGTQTPSGFQIKDTSAPSPSARLLQVVNILESEILNKHFSWEDFLRVFLSKAKIKRPTREVKSFAHPPDPMRKRGVPRIFRGKIGAANILLKDPNFRDKVANELGLSAIEMEGSGISDASWDAGVGYLLIRGTCDYGDTNKGDKWQQYAAHIAAAYLGALFLHLPTLDIKKSISEEIKAEVFSCSNIQTKRQWVINKFQLSSNRLTCCKLIPNENVVLCGGFDGILYHHQLPSDPVSLPIGSWKLRTIATNERWPFSLVGDDNGQINAVYRNKRIELGKTQSPIYSIAMGQQPNTMVVSERNGIVSEWFINIQKNNASRLRIIHKHEGAAFAVSYDKVGNKYLSVGQDGVLRTTCIQNGKQLKEHISNGALFALDLTHNSNRIAIGDNAGIIYIICRSDLQNERIQLNGHMDTVRNLRFSKLGNWLISGSKDGTVRLWHIDSQRVWILFHSSDYIYDLSFYSDNRGIVIVDGSGTLSYLSFPMEIDNMTPEAIDELSE